MRYLIRFFLLAGILLATLPVYAQQFEADTATPISKPEENSSGGSWGDYDGNGYEDLVVTNWFKQKNRLFANFGDGAFKEIEDAFPEDHFGESASSRWFDVENDGDLDLLITNINERSFFYLNKEGALVDEPNIGLVNDEDNVRFPGIADYDRDVDLDVLLSTPSDQINFLFRNNGPGVFKWFQDDVIAKDAGNSAPVCWGDADDDGDPDLFIGNIAEETDYLYWNEGTFAFKKEEEAAPVTTPGHTLSCAWVDVDNDGDLDLFATNQSGSNRLFRNQGGRKFEIVLNDPLVSDRIGGYGSAWGDVDNDGDVDGFVADREGNSTLYLNNGSGGFTPASGEPFSSNKATSVSGALADYDRDGYLDLFVANDGGPNGLYHNRGGKNSWINLRLVGDVSTPWGFGARITAMAKINGKPVTQRRDVTGGADYSQSSLRVHFGFGDAQIIDLLEVVWPSGIVNSYKNVPVNQFFDIVEGDDTPLPVTLVAFQALADGDALVLNWQTAGEQNNAGFAVQLASDGSDFTQVAFVPGAGTTDAPQHYTHRVAGLAPGRYQVRLRQIDFDGAFAYSPVRVVDLAAGTALHVEPAYPNPFNPVTTVRYLVQEDTPVHIRLYDSAGRQVRVLFEGTAPGGVAQQVVVDGAGLAGGLYLVRVAGAGLSVTRPILLMK